METTSGSENTSHEQGRVERLPRPRGLPQDDSQLPIYVNAYSVSRHYGGPEEGGWWYDVGEPLASVPMAHDATVEDTDAEKERIAQLLGWTSETGRYSVAGGDDFEVYVEEEAARPFPEETPRYE